MFGKILVIKSQELMEPTIVNGPRRNDHKHMLTCCKNRKKRKEKGK